MAEEARASAESQGAHMKARRPAERALGGPLRRVQRSVLKVSQLVLRAITEHKGLTLTTLWKELGNAGYEVREQASCHSREESRPEGSGTFLRISGSNAAGCFRVWKTPKPRRKPGRPRLEEVGSPSRRSPPRPRRPQRRRACRQAARKAQMVWRRSVWPNEVALRSRLRARKPARAGVRGRRPEARGRTSEEDTRRESRDQKRSSSKLGEEKKQEPEKLAKRTIQKPAVNKAARPCSGPGKARTKTSTKSEGPQNAAGSP